MKLKHIIVAGIGGLLISGCARNPEAFAKNMARHGCTNMKECNKGDYDDQYGDRGECRDDFERGWQELWDMAADAGCSFDEDAASTCYKNTRKYRRECDPPDSAYDTCGDVMDCGNALESAIGGMPLGEWLASLPEDPAAEIRLAAEELRLQAEITP